MKHRMGFAGDATLDWLCRFTGIAVLVAISGFYASRPVAGQSIFIDRGDVFIIASALTDPAGGALGSPFADQAVRPLFDPVVNRSGSPDFSHIVTINIPDMDPTQSGPRAGLQEGIAAGATVTVVFSQSAGIKNPTKAGAYQVGVATEPGGPAAGVGHAVYPNRPGAVASFEVSFTAAADIPANLGIISIIFDPDVQFPGIDAEPAPGSLADLSVSRAGFPMSAQIGATTGYNISVTNSGPAAATQVVLTEVLPTTSTLVSITPAQGSCRAINDTVECELGVLPRGSEVLISVDFQLSQGSRGQLTATATVSGAESDPNPGDNQLVSVFDLIPPPTAIPVPTEVPAATPSPTFAPMPTAVPTVSPVAASTPADAPEPTGTALPESIPVVTPAPPGEPPETVPPSDQSEAPLVRHRTDGFCTASFSRDSASNGLASLILLLAPVAMIPAYRRWRRWRR